MTFQYISDIHLEHYKIDEIIKLVPKCISKYLILAGDIGYPQKPQYKEYLKLVSQIWEKVFVVAGNHEYYQIDNINNDQVYNEIKTKDEIDKLIYDITTEFENVYFLQNSKIELDIDDQKFVILGTTLFSNVQPKNFIILSAINDFKYIYTINTIDTIDTTHDIITPQQIQIKTPIKLSDYIEFYNEAKHFLETELNYYK